MLNRLFCLHQILRKYGAPKPNKNKYSKAGKEQHQGKVMSTKRPISKPATKEKSVLNSVRCVTRRKGYSAVFPHAP